jgi:hypothetical protein
MSAFGFISGLAFAYAGWTALSIGMDRHYADIHGRGEEPDQRTRKRCRLLGTVALIATFAVSVKLEGWSVGAVLCLGIMTAGALLLVLLLTYAPHRAIRFGKAAVFLSVVFGMAWLSA